MLFDEKFLGFYASGSDIMFRSFSSDPIFVLSCPEDVDSHSFANALNLSANAIYTIARAGSDYKF